MKSPLDHIDELRRELLDLKLKVERLERERDAPIPKHLLALLAKANAEFEEELAGIMGTSAAT